MASNIEHATRSGDFLGKSDTVQSKKAEERSAKPNCEGFMAC